MYLFIPNPLELDKYNIRVYSYWKHSQVPIQTDYSKINWKCIFLCWLLGTCLLHPLLKTFQEICWCSLRIENKNCNFFLNPPPIIPDPDEDHILIGIRHGLGVKEYTSILRTLYFQTCKFNRFKDRPSSQIEALWGLKLTNKI